MKIKVSNPPYQYILLPIWKPHQIFRAMYNLIGNAIFIELKERIKNIKISIIHETDARY